MSYLEQDNLGIYKKHSGPGPYLMGAGTLIGEDVFNPMQVELGKIKEIMLDMRVGKVAYAVMSVGGVFGVGEKLFVVPWSALTLDTEKKRFLLNVEKEHLENAFGFDKNEWPDMHDQAWVDELHAYYGVKTYQNAPV